MSLNSEKLQHEFKARKLYFGRFHVLDAEEGDTVILERNELFSSIIYAGQIRISWMDAIVPLVIALFGVVSTTPYTLLPYHDLVLYPSYWYEILFPGTLIDTINFTSSWLFAASYMNLEYLSPARNATYICLVGIPSSLFFLLTSYYVWTNVLSYHYPIPLLGSVFTFLRKSFSIIVMWFYLPIEWRKNNNIKNRMKYWILHDTIEMITMLVYALIVQITKHSSDQYQPIAALMLPAWREGYTWISQKLLSRISNGDNSGARMIWKFYVYVSYAVNLCVVLGSVATDTTTLVLIGVDYCYNVWLCLKIIRIKRQHPNRIDEQIELLQDLALCELVEFLAPLGFLLTLIGAYYVPNSHLFGNIGNGYWAFEAIQNINEYLIKVTIFFLIDFSSTVATAIVLRFSCKINLCNALVELQTEFLARFCFILGLVLMMV